MILGSTRKSGNKLIHCDKIAISKVLLLILRALSKMLSVRGSGRHLSIFHVDSSFLFDPRLPLPFVVNSLPASTPREDGI